MNLVQIGYHSFHRVEIFQLVDAAVMNLVNNISYLVLVLLLVEGTEEDVRLRTIGCVDMDIKRFICKAFNG